MRRNDYRRFLLNGNGSRVSVLKIVGGAFGRDTHRTKVKPTLSNEDRFGVAKWLFEEKAEA